MVISKVLDLVQGTECSFTMIGKDNLERVMDFLDTNSFISCNQVCKAWYSFGKNKEIWFKRFVSLEKKIFANSVDRNIYDELGTNFAKISVDKEGHVRETSLNKLVAALTPQAEVPDTVDVSTFLVTYQTFTTTKDLIRKLFQRYIVPEIKDANSEESKNYLMTVVRPIQARVCKLLKQVIESQYREIDFELMELIKLFVYGVVDQKILSKMVQTGVRAALDKVKKENQQIKIESSNPILTAKKGQLLSIHDFSSEEIARQLCLMEWEIYSKIKASEFFGQAWAKPKSYHRAPHIRAMIERFNVITRWISTEIIVQEKLRNRVRQVVKFIKVACSLRQLHNYHTLMAVLSGINEVPVYRLKYTRAEIPHKYQQTLAELTTLMSADGSYNAYRIELSSLNPPCIPYIGIYLRDLTYFDEGSQVTDGLINFNSKKNVYSVIQIIQKYQTTQFPYKFNEKICTFLKNIDGLDDDTLFKTSLLREPKNTKRSNIQ